MKSMRIRGLVAVSATLLATVAAATFPLSGASADNYEKSFTATVDQVLVNRAGGITVSGRLDCTAAVAAAYGGEQLIPPDTTVYVGVHWTATQYVGRNKVVQAQYNPGIAHPCYNNDPSLPVGTVAPWPWATRYAYPVGTIQWVYSDTGKFAPGAIHIELEADGVPFSVGVDTFTVYSLSGWDLRAEKVR